jgi:hypothetical protein
MFTSSEIERRVSQASVMKWCHTTYCSIKIPVSSCRGGLAIMMLTAASLRVTVPLALPVSVARAAGPGPNVPVLSTLCPSRCSASDATASASGSGTVMANL